jgi:hypothetical protein
MNRDREALDQFGATLIREVRDQSIMDWDMLLDNKMKGARAERLRQFLASLHSEELHALRRLVPQVVDTTLHYLLLMIEETGLRVSVQMPSGELQDLKEISDGLPGELYSDQGWIARFSKERYEALT